MKQKYFKVEWVGIFTRDIGWAEVAAGSVEEAREIYESDHGTTRKVRAVYELEGVK